MQSESDDDSEYEIEAMAAIGRRATLETLPDDASDREHPNQRKDLNEIVFEGDFDRPAE